ncbi:uncharacterized MFS-type transporter C09D4.1-like [Coccinella septempunctata]|uniref:uncharacterized MFS-type transporter C09D4.1-like n=1 Tax=Coccinella septempunctata TaxID=41139 RepID=UPI001D07B3E5|nr:uncharacterized MFS-type transporter C09D4.1-like [Coccinella septempunctata]
MENMEIEPSRSTDQQENQFKTYKYRFLIVIIYGLYSGANLYQLNQFTIIENVVHEYFKTTSFMVGLSQLTFMVALVVFIAPVVRIVEKHDLRIAGLLCSGFTLLGAVIKLLATGPNERDFKIILVGQTICGFAQVFTIMLPAKVVAVWFPAEEQNRACAAALFGGEIGMLLGAVFPILFVEDKKNDAEIQQGIYQMLLYNAIFCGIAFIAVVIFFKAKPPTPPSAQQAQVGDHKTHYYTAFFELSVNRDFLTLIVLYGIACGLWTVFGIIENIVYLNYFPDSLLDLTYITAITSISGGMIGNYLFGYILDKTLKYKLFTFMIFLCMAVSYAAMAICFEMRWHGASFVTMILFGFFCSSCVSISFQYLAEVTFPVSEVVPIAVLQVILCTATIFYQIIYSVLLDHKLFKVIHAMSFASFCGITAGTYFLTSNLKRMLVKQPRSE